MAIATFAGVAAGVCGAPGAAYAEGIGQAFPDLKGLGTVWRYDSQKAVALSDRFLEQVRRLSSYSCNVRTFYSTARLGALGLGTKDHKRPNEEFSLTVFYHPMTAFVRLSHPRKGATIFYRSVDQVAQVRPFHFLPFSISLSPHSSLITSRFGHSIDHSDFRNFDKRVLRPACLTHSCLYLGSGVFEGRRVEVLNIAPDQLEARPVFGRMWLLLDRDTTLPISVVSLGPSGQFWERIDYRGCHFSFRSP